MALLRASTHSMNRPGRAISASYFTPLFLGFAALGCLLLGIFGFLQQQEQDYGFVREAVSTRRLLNNVVSTLLEAESGQRGYLLTGDRRYRASFDGAGAVISEDFKNILNLQGDSLTRLEGLGPLRQKIEQKLSELRATVELEGAGKHAEALGIVESGSGRTLMGLIRAQTNDLLATQWGQLDGRLNWAEQIGFWLRYGALASIFLAAGLAFVAVNQLRRRLASLASASDSLVSARDELENANTRLIAEAQHRAQLGEQLRQAQKMEAIGQLTGGLAHDFNNMLAVIVGSLNLIRRRLARGDTEVGRYLDSAMDGAERATKLTNRLLAFSRQQPLAPVALDPNRMVAGMAELLRSTLSDNVALETVLAGGLWRALADPNQLENSVLNIAINARDAMPGGGKLTIETSNAFLDDKYAATHFGVAAGQYALICVTDTGVGMAPDMLTKVFDPFFTTKAPGKGTGLGLSQVFGFVKQSGGHVAIYSEPGQGTTVKVYLPRSYRENETRVTSRIPAAAFPAGKTSEIVLVAEDDERVIQLTVDSLRELGYTVLHADSGASALLKLDAAAHVDLLFTDIVMPGMDGRQLAEEALNRHPDLKVLFTTGYAPNSVVHNGTLDYGEDLIGKPYSIDQLASKIRDVLDRPRVIASPAQAKISMLAAPPASMEPTWKH